METDRFSDSPESFARWLWAPVPALLRHPQPSQQLRPLAPSLPNMILWIGFSIHSGSGGEHDKANCVVRNSPGLVYHGGLWRPRTRLRVCECSSSAAPRGSIWRGSRTGGCVDRRVLALGREGLRMDPGALGAPSAARGSLGARLLGRPARPAPLARRPLALNEEKALAAAQTHRA